MAKQAAKKLVVRASGQEKWFRLGTMIACSMASIFRLKPAIISGSGMSTYAGMIGVEVILYMWIRSALFADAASEFLIDLFGVHTLALFLWSFTDSAWYVYYLIPVYIAYNIFLWLYSFAQRTGSGTKSQ